MELTYLSHPNKRLTDHIEHIVAFDTDELFQTAAKFHDLGKVCDKFQHYIKKETNNSEPHSAVSAIAFLINRYDEFDLKSKFFIFNAIRSHHGLLASKKYLINMLLDDNSKELELCKKQLKEILSKCDVCSYFKIDSDDMDIVFEFGFEIENLCFDMDDYVTQKLLYSKLIFADKYEAITSSTFISSNFNYSLTSLYAYKKEQLCFDFERTKIAQTISENYQKNPNNHLYTLTAPTGIGKTLISLELALKIANKRGKDRIIYTIPFTSIIDQTVAIFERIFPNQIIKHHHKVDFKEDDKSNCDYDRIKYLIESWSHSFIVSTFYQLFFAIFSNKNSDNVKLQSLCNSVIVLDEVQAIPFELWKVLQILFDILAKKLNAVFILMSATMPIITNNAIELAPKEQLFQKKNRYRIDYLKLEAENEDARLQMVSQKIFKMVKNGDGSSSILCVVNTIKNSKRLYHLLANMLNKKIIYVLNSYMLPKDREATIEALREPNSNRVKGKILISTQVIEAGIDLDFDIGLRELSPLSSIIQTAGRVNREGKREQAEVFVFDTLGFEIYDSVLINATKHYLKETLESKGVIEEANILTYVENFFKTLDIRLSDRKKILKAIENFDFNEISKATREIFKTESDYTVSIVLGIDLKDEELKYFKKSQTLNRWELKNYKEQRFKAFTSSIINIKRKDLEILGMNVRKSDIFGLYYIDYLDGIYDSKTGFLIAQEYESLSVFN